MVGWHHWFNGHESEQTPGDSERQGSLACCSPWGRRESDTKEQWNNNDVISCIRMSSLFVYKQYSIVCIHHIHFNPLISWWTFGLLPFLLLIMLLWTFMYKVLLKCMVSNPLKMNFLWIGMHMELYVYVCGIYGIAMLYDNSKASNMTERLTLSLIVTLRLNCWRTAKLFSKVVICFTISLAVYKDSNFFISLSTIIIICLFHYSHPSFCDVVSHWSFAFNFPDG